MSLVTALPQADLRSAAPAPSLLYRAHKFGGSFIAETDTRSETTGEAS